MLYEIEQSEFCFSEKNGEHTVDAAFLPVPTCCNRELSPMESSPSGGKEPELIS